MAPVNRLAPQGLDGLGHGPERLLGSLGDHTGGQIAISDRVVEIARASADASTAVEAVPSSDRAPISNMVSAPGTAQLARVLVHPLFLSLFFSPPLPSLSLSALGRNPPQPGRLLFRLHPPFFFPFLLFLLRHPSLGYILPFPNSSPLLFLLFPPDFLPFFPSYFYSNWDAVHRRRAIHVRSEAVTEEGDGESFPPLSKRIRIFELGSFFGSVPMNFCEPGFGSIPVGWRGFNKVYGD